MGITQEELKEAIEEIVRLNPRPGGQIDDSYEDQAQQIIPDFLLEEKDGELIMSMPKFSVPELKVNRRYAELLMDMEICKLEKWDVLEFPRMIKQALDICFPKPVQLKLFDNATGRTQPRENL